MSIDIRQVSTELRKHFPHELGAADARLVGEGFSSYAVSMDGCTQERWLFRIARNADTQAGHRRESAMLPLLHNRLPLPIPRPHFHAGPSKAFPFGLIGYAMLDGVTWTLDMGKRAGRKRIAHQLADFLSALHAFPVESARAAGIPANDARALVQELLPALPRYVNDAAVRRFRAWREDAASHPDHYAYTPRLLHNDLWCENILLTPDLSRTVGIVDFEQMCIGDPVAEFAALRYVGNDFIASVRAAYPAAENLEPHFDARLAAAVVLRELGGLRYALRYPEANELDDAVEKVTLAIDQWLP